MPTRLPPLNALRAFEAAARHLSFTKAADELSVTQAAVSYQIRQLEDHVGRPLFRRLTRRLELTAEGADFHAAVADAFERIREAAERLAARRGDQVLSITTLPTFASQWLVPRLGHFQVMRPDLAVRLESSARLVDLERGEFDLAIRSGKGDWPGMVVERLVPFILTPALSPSLAERAGGIHTPADLLKLSFLDSQHPEDRAFWLQWFELAGHPVDHVPGGLQYDTHMNTGQAAGMGQGVALVCPSFFAPDIATGRLVVPFPDVILDTGRAYWLVYPKRRAQEPKIKAFRDWVLSEVTACAGQCMITSAMALGPRAAAPA